MKTKQTKSKKSVVSPGKMRGRKGHPPREKVGPPSALGGAQKLSIKSGQSPDEQSPAMASLEARWSINALIDHAEGGHAEAARYLREVLVDATRALYALCSAHPTAAKSMKQPGAPWPILHTDLKKEAKGGYTFPEDHLLRALGVIRSVRSMDDSARGTAAAKALYHILDSIRRGPRELTTNRESEIQGLDSLTKETLPSWWQLAKPFIREWWGDEFQDHPEFTDWHREIAGRVDRHQQAKLSRGIRRSRIESDIHQGLKSLASGIR